MYDNFCIDYSVFTMAGLGGVSGKKNRASEHSCHPNPIAAVMIIILLPKRHLSVPYGYVSYITYT